MNEATRIEAIETALKEADFDIGRIVDCHPGDSRFKLLQMHIKDAIFELDMMRTVESYKKYFKGK